jgi:hypothetical protein
LPLGEHAVEELAILVAGRHQLARRPVPDPAGILAVLALRLAADDVRDAREGHQVPLVGGVDEDPGRERRAVLRDDLGDPRPLLHDAAALAEAMLAEDLDLRLLGHPVEDRLGHVGLDEPGDHVAERPRAVVRAGIPVELVRVSGDHLGAGGVGPRQPAGDHPPDVPLRLDEGDPEPLTRRGHGGDHARSRAAVDHHIELGGGRRGTPRHSEEQRQARGESPSHAGNPF